MDRFIKYAGLIAAIITVGSSSVVIYLINELRNLETDGLHSNTLFIVLIATIILLIVFVIVFYVIIYHKHRISKANKIRTYFNKYVSNPGSNYIRNNTTQDVLDRTAKSIDTLIKKGITKPLESDVYYLYLYSLLNGAKKWIWATSIMGEEEWVNTAEEEEFVRLNLEAPNRKVLFERIFIIKQASIEKLLKTDPVLKQIDKRNDYFKTYIVVEEELISNKPHLLTDIGSGFLAFDDFAVAVDVFEDSFIRGTLALDSGSIDRYNRIFTNLRDFAHPLDRKFVSKFNCTEQ